MSSALDGKVRLVAPASLSALEPIQRAEREPQRSPFYFKQLEALRSMRCPEAQGYWFSKPLDNNGIGALLSDTLGTPH